jgi:hypothetical protein
MVECVARSRSYACQETTLLKPAWPSFEQSYHNANAMSQGYGRKADVMHSLRARLWSGQDI